MKHKGMMIILDGLGDRPVAALGGATPLEAAHTPHMDAMVAAGRCGLVDTLYPGMPVDTHTGAGVLLGLKPGDAFHLPRGPVEAAGTGLPIMPGEIALRCNFATLEADGNSLRILDRRAGRISEGTHELADALQDIPLGEGFTASIRPATGHRAVMRLSGPGPLPEISDTDPGSSAEPCPVSISHSLDALNPLGEEAANALNRLVREAHARLDNHPVNQKRRQQGKPPANGILTRGAGTIGSIHNILHHLGLHAAVVAGERTLVGLANLFNFTAISQPGFTSMPDTDLAGKIAAALAALEEHDIVFLHIKAPDIHAHDRNPVAKKEGLELIDNALLPLLREEIVIGITADHTTDSNTGRHCGDPVPSLICSAAGRKDKCNEFGETPCLAGALGRIRGHAFLLSVLDEMQCLQNYQTADSPYYI
ncbi:MAG: 2,3-bisphosphoglycerate-independent phosphoglycerate mutase [Gammaproteobacteria bacterium]|nr:MAG: 2,3-bisphosphoglycerate-independent phosphoglycerate mutase [Gammaproteobacteria bacterium]